MYRVSEYLLIGLGLLPLISHAHLVGSAGHGEAVDIWLIDPVATALLLLVAGLYWRGSRQLGERQRLHTARRQRYFWWGWLALALVLSPPLDGLGEVLFSAHMVQHEVMMLIAGPLLVLSRPGSALLRGMPRRLARGVGTLVRRGRGVWPLLVTPTGAWIIHALGLWGWHVPVLFNAGLMNTWVHALQHLCFLLISLIFWYALFRPRRQTSAFGVVYLFTTAIHTGMLGALLTLSPRVWYLPYLATAPHWGFAPLDDQQLGGLIMWIPAGVVFIGVGLWSLAGVIGGHRQSQGHLHEARKEQLVERESDVRGGH